MDLNSNIFIKIKWKKLFLVLALAALMIAAIVYFKLIKPSMPWSAAEGYVSYIKAKDYIKASELYLDIPKSIMISQDGIIACLKDKYDDVSNIAIKSIKPLNQKGLYDVTMEITKQDNSYEEIFTIFNTKKYMLGLKREWGVVFPFKTADVNVMGMDGTRVFVDDREVGVIKDGKLSMEKVLWGKYNFKGKIDGIAESSYITSEINGESNNVDIKLIVLEEFKKSLEKLIWDFAQGWSNYCINQKPDSIKPYLTDKLYNEFISDDDMFKDSKYLISEGSVEIKGFELVNKDMVSMIVDEKWHLKEVATSKNIVFEDNKKTYLEQYQYITYEYSIINDSGIWKINSCKQLEFRKDIIK